MRKGKCVSGSFRYERRTSPNASRICIRDTHVKMRLAYVPETHMEKCVSHMYRRRIWQNASRISKNTRDAFRGASRLRNTRDAMLETHLPFSKVRLWYVLRCVSGSVFPSSDLMKTKLCQTGWDKGHLDSYRVAGPSSWFCP